MINNRYYTKQSSTTTESLALSLEELLVKQRTLESEVESLVTSLALRSKYSGNLAQEKDAKVVKSLTMRNKLKIVKTVSSGVSLSEKYQTLIDSKSLSASRRSLESAKRLSPRDALLMQQLKMRHGSSGQEPLCEAVVITNDHGAGQQKEKMFKTHHVHRHLEGDSFYSSTVVRLSATDTQPNQT